MGDDPIFELDELLRESCAAAERRQSDYFWEAAAEGPGANGAREFVIYGGGDIGRKCVAALALRGITPAALADAKVAMQGTHVDGVAVLSPVEAAGRFGESAVWIIAVLVSEPCSRYPGIEAELRGLGVRRFLAFLPLLWTAGDRFLPHHSLQLPGAMLAHGEEIRSAMGLWSDDLSRELFLRIARWRLRGTMAGPMAPSRGQYFQDDLFRLGEEAVFVDCGAFDGDTLGDFLKKTGSRFRRVFAFEPDPANRARLSHYVGALAADVRGKIDVFPYAVSDREGLLRFCASGDLAASISASGTTQVRGVALDAFLADERPTLIKMDIEGAELNGIAGAAKVIRRYRPILAITVYHGPEDLWKIPLAIHGLCEGYRFYLRSHAMEFWETVCYAVPND
jgi:FkbM family methyltransferase